MATYYVRPVNGDDSNGGTGPDNAWKTIRQAIDSVTGDTEENTIYLYGETAEGITASLTVPQVARTYTNYFIAVGPSGETGDLLDYTYTIRADAAMTAVLEGAVPNSNAFAGDYDMYGVVFDANNNATYAYQNTSNAGANVYFYGCKFKNAISHGVYEGGYQSTQYNSCEYFDNGGGGFISAGANRGNSVHRNGSFHDNTGSGIFGGNSINITSCTIYNNGSHGCQGRSRYSVSFNIENSLIYNNGGDGIEIENSSDTVGNNRIRNNIIYGNGGWGIQSNATSWKDAVIYNNFISNNTSGSLDLDTPLRNWQRNYLGIDLDFDIATGKLNYSSEYEDAVHPFGGAPGGVAREDEVAVDTGGVTGEFDSSLSLNSTVTFGSGKKFRLASKTGIPVWRRV